MDARKRHISLAPHRPGTFGRGEFVYDPEAPWEALRSGMVSERGGEWWVWFPPFDLQGHPLNEPLGSYAGPIGRHILIDHFGLGPPRGPDLDPRPWIAIRAALMNRLRDADRWRLRLDPLVAALKAEPGLDPDLVEDAMRMFASMGLGKVWRDKGGLWFGAAKMIRDGFSRRDYLSSFSHELLAKSRRIDNLINHSGTVGTYREELLRSLIRQLLPTRYQVSTGFLENSPRQLDVIVWDAEQYAPLFREQEVVVVPSDAVRAIIEVKTTLTANSLKEALDIMYETLRVEQPRLPIFKGIFAFESDYVTDAAVARRLHAFFNAKERNGITDRRHRYLGQGINAVCVPKRNYLYQRYLPGDDHSSFPRPFLMSLLPEGRGDIRTGVFLGELLSHLDLEMKPKRVLMDMFLPIFGECRTSMVKDLFGPEWRPTLAAGHLSATLKPEAANSYVRRIEEFRFGRLAPDEAAAPPPSKRPVRKHRSMAVYRPSRANIIRKRPRL